ncbi:MAG: hypothetical protein M1839_008838 [Geoglossum umbratile]|nr:MAG: hypothetical protein M1839_008838 [Geoglossum umbratile]
MSMAGMNSVGGPVGGMPIMNNGTGGQRDESTHSGDAFPTSALLNTYIYDYFLKNGLHNCARTLLNSNVPLKVVSDSRISLLVRRDADGNVIGNGVDDNAMDTAGSKDDGNSKRPDDLPDAKVPPDCPTNSFLFDWWCVFWEMYAVQRRTSRDGGGTAMAYMQHTQAQQRIRQEQQRLMLGHQNPQMMAGPMSQYQNQIMMRGMQNGMNMGQNDMARTAMNNSRKSTPQQIQLAQKQMLQQQMNRGEGSDMDMNGPRPQSPSSAENAPSPSKRPRLESGQFSGQPMGRGQPQMQGQVNAASAQQAHNLLIANGINPNQLTASQFNSFQQQNPGVQQKSIQVYAQNLAQHQRSALQSQTMPKGIPNPGGVPNHGSPMMQQGSESGQNLGPVMDTFYTGGNAPNMRSGMAPGGSGNHALQDYQMQLMLLEQQNKKRLLMARQEQDSLTRSDQPGVGQPGFQGMSPQGSRAGPSPNPSDQMKRGTPKLNQPGLPTSPMPDGSMPQTQQRNSPAAMGFQGQMPPEIAQGFYQMKNLNDNVPNGNVMRPPSSHPPSFSAQMNPQQLEQMQRQRALNGNWQGQGQPGQAQMMAQHQQGQQAQQMGTPGQRNTMPPPQAPPAGNNNGRTQPSSPQQSQAPPTPQPSSKANPKAKKDKEPRKPPRKKGSTANLNSAATPSSEPEPPPTPTPSTPITPHNSSSFGGQKAPNGPAQAGSNGQTAATAPAPASTIAPPQPDSNQVAAFPMDGGDTQFNMDFGPLEGGDVLDQFDFDSFLNTDDNTSGPFVFDTGPLAYPQDGVEAGTGD